MKQSTYCDAQIACTRRQADSGMAVADLCRQFGISDATLYVRKKRFGHVGVGEVRELWQLRQENSKRKRLVADLTLGKHILTKIVRKKSRACTASGTRRVGAGELRSEPVMRLRVLTAVAGAVLLRNSATRSHGVAAEHSEARRGATALRLPARPRAAAPRELACDLEAGATPVSPGRPAVAPARASARARELASRHAARGKGGAPALEHRFRARRAG